MSLDTIISIAEFILALGVIILLHEFGHFIMGRLNHIEVEEFGIGYPPRMLKLFTWKGTVFTLNWIPFGGFCRFKGESDPNIPGGLTNANKWARLGTYLGGPVMNLILAVLLFALVISQFGKPQTNIIEIMQVTAGSPAAEIGLLPGDVILQASGQEIKTADTLTNITQQNLGKEMTLVISRNNQTLNFTIIPRSNPPEGQGPMGIVMGNPMQPVNFFESIPLGLQNTIEMGKQLIMLPVMLIRGQVNPSEVRLMSPVGIYDVYSQVRTASIQSSSNDGRIIFLNLVSFFAIISAALGFTNLLPIPAVDGGHIFFLLPELFFNKKVPAKYENLVHSIGFTVLLIIMVYVLIQDVINPVVLPK